ncbi:hypothetical protein [Terribacillus saccharophilus]|uniref:hypothetical protein n=1 Tax=Terribacillus saccharophilus TaxID=361277 RepID=UPI000C9AF03F|nr:hypothetical protein [Terribacillus goriensis]
MAGFLMVIFSILLFLPGIGLLIAFAILKKKMWIWISSGMVVASFILFAVGVGMITMDAYDAASESETTVTETDVVEQSEDEVLEEESADEPTQEELNEQLKENAIKGDFVEMNGERLEIGTPVYLEGKVSIVTNDSEVMPKYDFVTEEGDGYGHYSITDISSSDVPSEGDRLKIYGSYHGKEEDTGIPIVYVHVVEKQ